MRTCVVLLAFAFAAGLLLAGEQIVDPKTKKVIADLSGRRPAMA